MKIITWNCNGAFRKKFEVFLNLNIDIFVIQECENPAETSDPNYKNWAENYLWIGDTKNKGLGIFASKNIQLKRLNWSDKYNDDPVKYFLPCSVNGDFNLLAVWTHHNNSPKFGYIGQFWKYLQNNIDEFGNVLMAGDFNSNVIWDKPDRWWNHSNIVTQLRGMGIESLYHKFYNEVQGKELQPTFYLHRNFSKQYHIDYFFASQGFQERLKDVIVGKYENWKHLSDHIPIEVIFT